jgi:8-oxo-dGTP diphosphatase
MKFATLCYVRRAGKTLMIHRTKRANDMHHGKWNGLGGKLMPGETPEECAAREIFEESGLDVVSMHLKGFLTFPRFTNEEDWYAFVFVVDEFMGEFKESPEGYLEWIDDERLCDLALWEGDRFFLPWIDQPGFFSAKFIYEDGKYIDHEVVFYK